ncbi:MAG: type I restriction endonuclease subunit R [Flavobacteriaceae bacterium]
MIFQEDYSSQLPALRTLINLGYQYLSQEEVMAQRYDRTSNVLLEPILKEQLAKFNEIRVSSTHTEKFTQSNIDEAALRLKEIPLEQGYLTASAHIYELLTLGTTLDQTIEGNRREYTLQYIDWKHPENNVFHLAEEFRVATTDGKTELRPDIVLFVNGIPLSVIENKREDMDDPIKQAISQHNRNQQEDRIRKLYFYAQILLSCAVNEAKYGTNGTPENFWSDWKEKEIETEKVEAVKNKVLAEETRKKIMAQRQSSQYFNKEQAQLISNKLTKAFALTQQDILLLSVASPMRLLDLVSNFILYDKGVKKIARYQQYFAVKNAMKQVTGLHSNPRPGGVIWHTQGSGKSLTMALMAEAIARDETIKNPKIILVTDRTDLDKQITGTFRNIGLEVLNAKSGKSLVEILESNTDAVITTIINKFESAIKRIKEPLEGNNIFVLVDEGHRTQHGTFNINMQKTMPNACYIAFTGTPLFKKDKSTMRRFGTMIDQYTVKQAVVDGAVLPLVYEGRSTAQEVNKKVIDNYFQMVAEDLSDYERADLKKKFSQRSQIADADQNIYAIAWDITRHYQENFQGTGLKGQLICSTKRTAVKYYNYLKQIGKVSVALVISAPDDREGEESAYTSTSEDVKKFWSAMMDQHANAKKYEENTISHFKHEAHPEIIIVVDKLLTGFDAPRNTVLYLTRKLRGHTLLQAIARVNRLFPDKDYGYIVDYAGVVEELDDALLTYSDMEEFDEKDLEGTLTSIQDEVESLDPAHQELLDIFKQIKNKDDLELYQQALREKDVRDDFYKRLANYARILKLALSSIEFHNKTNEKRINKYKSDLKFFMNLRTAVAQRFSDKVDYKQYEGQIQKLIDQHIATQGVEQLTELVNIFDEEAFQKEVEKTVGEAAKADKIASRTSKHISEKMDEDPVFYKKFSQMIQQAINDFYDERISELEYLNRIKDYREKVLTRTDSEIPEKIRHNPTASAYYGIVQSFYKDKDVSTSDYENLLVEASLQTQEIIEARKVVNWRNNQDVLKKMVLNIGDYIYDEIGEKIEVKINFSEIDEIAEKIVSTAKARE